MLDLLPCLRLVSDASALDRIEADAPGWVMRVAPDELLVFEAADSPIENDTIVAVTDEGFAGFEANRPDIVDWVGRHADWPLHAGDGFSQGAVAGLPVKIATTGDRALVVTATSFLEELEARL